MSETEPWSALEFETRAQVDAAPLTLLSVEGVAAISEPYRYEIRFEYSSDGGLAPEQLDDLLRQPCTVRWGPDGQSVIHGTLDMLVSEPVDSMEHLTYRAILEPRVTLLRHTVRCRVFQELSVIDIARAVLGEHGLAEGDDFRVTLAGDYPTSEYTVQYQESDFAFVSRQLESAGVHYHFVQARDRECMVIADQNAHFPERGAMKYGTLKSLAGVEGVTALETTRRRGPAEVLVSDYNWRTPAIALRTRAPADSITGLGHFHEHGTHHKTPAEGAEAARIRAERITSARERCRALGAVYEGGAGYRFELEGHPLGECDGEYLIVRDELTVRSGKQPTHSQRFELTRTEHPFRGPERTPKPRIYGLMHAHIDAPMHSTAAPIDKNGCYKVLMPFDVEGNPGGRASRWIRVAQPSSGGGYGTHLPLHNGAEVAIAHLDGDPDRPVIVGSVHNTNTVNPVTEVNPTQSWIRTQAGIRVTFDDDVQ